MTKGTFVINGAEARHRLPDRPFPRRLLCRNADKADNITYAVTVIPYRERLAGV